MTQYFLLPSLLISTKSSKLKDKEQIRGGGRGRGGEEKEERSHLFLESTCLIQVHFHG